MKAPAETIRPRDRDTIIQALAAGVVPRVGLQFIQVGREKEIEALIRDIDRVADGGSAIRFIIGSYGAGKTFFLNLIRAIALKKKLVTIHADLSPAHRFFSTRGEARNLYSETVRNMATRNKADGALSSVVEVFISKIKNDADKSGKKVDSEIRSALAVLQQFSGGFEFVEVLTAYWQAWEEGSEDKKAAAIRWLRGEYTTRTDARKSLGVRKIIDDSAIYEHWKLLAKFIRLAGYGGLLIVLDELVNVYKLQNSKARESNYEQILRILNDVLQGNVEGIGFVLGGTPEFLRDPRRGMFSYPALHTRLGENSFAKGSYVDLSGPVINLQNLTPNDFYVLLSNVRNVFASGDPKKNLIPDNALKSFMSHCEKRIGEAYFRTPRTTIKEFVNLLSVLEQNPDADWKSLLEKFTPQTDVSPDMSDIVDPDDGKLTSITLQ
jgi:hypothetical protein